jgi:hypothetical protein
MHGRGRALRDCCTVNNGSKSVVVVVFRKLVFVVCRKSVCCCLSLFRVVLDYEVSRSCSEGARTRALTKLTVSCPPPGLFLGF